MKIFLILELICIALQFLSFLPFYITWKGQCKESGKDRLAVPLHERFLLWVLFCPIWSLPILIVPALSI